MLVRRDGRLSAELRPKPDAPKAEASKPDVPKQDAPKAEVGVQQQAPKAAPVDSTAKVRAQITDMIRKELPALTAVYNAAMQKEASKQPIKKQPEKQTLSSETERKATTARS
jgi:hypothetical protein